MAAAVEAEKRGGILMALEERTLAGAKKAFSFLEEFKNFAFKGNLIDLAVAVIIGGAFGKLVDSFVKDVVMQLVAGIIAWIGSFANVTTVTGYKDWAPTIAGVPIHIGSFLGELVNFVLVAFVVYLFIVRLLSLIVRKRAEEPPKATRQEELLTEIRDLLKQQRP
jgi:large conductance mechanosensitive channel